MNFVDAQTASEMLAHLRQEDKMRRLQNQWAELFRLLVVNENLAKDAIEGAHEKSPTRTIPANEGRDINGRVVPRDPDFD